MENKLNHNSKQTAVNWVIGEIIRHQMTMYGTASIPLYILQKGIEMEKGQIKEAFKHGELPPLFINFDSEQYYNETYGGK